MLTNNQQTISGNALRIFDVGVLLLGASGTGKSDVSLDLLTRGHALVADDSVCLSREGDHLFATCPSLGQGFLYAYELGMVDVTHAVHAEAYASCVEIELAIRLESKVTKLMDLLEPSEQLILLEISIPCFSFSHFTSRPMAAIIETLVRCFKLQKKGYNALSQFCEMQYEQMDPYPS